MNSFKSCKLIQEHPRLPRKSRRTSKLPIPKDELLVANPFRQADQENYLPPDLQDQVQHFDYLTPTQIQTIHFPTSSGARRSSLFARHLQAMQKAAKKQQEMYGSFLDCKSGKAKKQEAEAMEEEQPMTIEDDENLSTRMNCFLMLDDDGMEPQELLAEPQPEEDIIFYSQNQIEPSGVSDDFDAYFD